MACIIESVLQKRFIIPERSRGKCRCLIPRVFCEATAIQRPKDPGNEYLRVSAFTGSS